MLPPTVTFRVTVSGTDPPAAGSGGEPGTSRAPLSPAEWKPTLCQLHIPGQAPLPASQRVFPVFSTADDLLVQPWHLQAPSPAILPPTARGHDARTPKPALPQAGNWAEDGEALSKLGGGGGDSWVGPTRILPA